MGKLILPALPKFWTTVLLGQIANIEYGDALREEDRNENGSIPVYGSNGIVGHHDKAVHPGPSIIIGRKGTAGSVHYSPGPFFSIDTTFYLTNISSAVNIEYLAYILAALNLSRIAIIVGVPGINRKDLLRETIPLPTLPEQLRIVDILREAEELRQLRRRADSKLEEIYQSIFADMFGNILISSKERILIRDISTLVTSGSTPRGGEAVYVTEGPYFIRSQNVLMNHLDLSDVASITTNTHQSMIRTRVMNGDVLLNITGASIGRVAWVEKLDHEANVNQHVCIIRPNQEKVLPEYLSIYISLPITQDYIMVTQAGASRQALNHEQVRKLKIFVPPIERQYEFVKKIRVAREIINTPKEISSQLNDLLGSIAERSFSGNLTKIWREANSEVVHDASVEQSILLGERPKEPRLIHYETGEVTRAERERFDQMVSDSFYPAVQQLTRGVISSLQVQDIAQGPLLKISQAISPLAESMAEMVNNSLARQVSKLAEAQRTALAAAFQPLMQMQAQMAEQISEVNSGILAFAIRLSHLASEASRRPDENHPRYYALAGLSDEQYWVYLAARRQEGYFTSESLSEAEGLPYDAIRRHLPLLETLGLISRVTVVVNPSKEEIYFVDAFRKPSEAADTQASDLTYLKTSANQTTGTV